METGVYYTMGFLRRLSIFLMTALVWAADIRAQNSSRINPQIEPTGAVGGAAQVPLLKQMRLSLRRAYVSNNRVRKTSAKKPIVSTVRPQTHMTRTDPNPASTAVMGGGGAGDSRCGLLATYYTGLWNGDSAQRVDKTLHLPFGNSQIYGVPYNVPLDGSSPGNAHPLRSAKWRGQIRAPQSEQFVFYVSVDNEAWLNINGKEVLHRSTGGYGGVVQYQKSTPVLFKAGEWMDIEIRILEHHPRTPTHLKVEWASPSTPRGKIPCENLNPLLKMPLAPTITPRTTTYLNLSPSGISIRSIR